MARWLGFAAGATAAAALLVPEIRGRERRAPWPIVLAARPALAGAVGAVAAGAATARPLRPLALGAATVAAAVLADPRRRSRGTTGPTRLTVLVANVWQGRADAAALAAILRAERPDLVVLPEAGERFLARLKEDVTDLEYRAWSAPPPHPHHRVPDDPDGPWTSVLAAPRLGDVHVAPARAGGLYGWLEVSGGGLDGVRVLAAHPVAPTPGLVQRWSDEIDALAAWRAAAGAPTVIAGDLNSTTEHRALAPLGDARAPGRPPTWPSHWHRRIGFRIDHVLAGGGIAVRSTRVIDLPGSDHRAVLAHLG
ncbi:endonuclease/exonuclease/phosphatase family protein [Actinomycetospora succinea]|uniref:endonuclease/exonuclease/phosphatase family protein n=1 Tax=Actinomycetospora succinea TaxID=663603 RepID=UPI00105EE80F|nr:endonuclease/exonuclease/phosphatase family protein [Actinomycetospora succinea]